MNEIKTLKAQLVEEKEDERTAAAIYDKRTERTLDGMKALFHQYEYEARYNTERTEEEIAMFIKLADEMKEKIFNYVMERMDEEDDHLPFN